MMMMPLIKPPLVAPCSTISRRREFYLYQKDVFSACLLKELKQANSTDVILVSKDGKEFPSHKFILRALSSFFRSMFGGSFLESSYDRVLLHSIHSRIMCIILEYVELEFEGHQVFEESVRPVATEVLLAAHMLDIPGLIQLSCTILGENLTHENYKEVWTLYSSCNAQMLKDYLSMSFRDHYRQLLIEIIFLNFDLSLIKFVFEQSKPFINHKCLVKMMLQWVKHDLKNRECSLGELVTMLNKERLPSDYIQHLAKKEELLQKHPEVLKQFPTAKRMVEGSVEGLEADDGDKNIADSVSVVVFRRSMGIVQRLSFSGCTEERELPWHLPMTSTNTRACVQYKKKVCLVGMVATSGRSILVTFDFDDNVFDSFGFTKMLALKFRDAFVVEDRMYVHCSDSNGWFVQCYDFCTGEWKYLLELPERASLCPYQNSFLILQPDANDDDAIMVTKFNETQFFTIPTDYDNGIFFHCNGRIFGFLDYSNKQFVYEVDKKCLKLTETCLSSKSTAFFKRVSSHHHPLIAKYEKGIVTLIDIEYGVELGKVNSNRDWIAWAPYCKDQTL